MIALLAAPTNLGLRPPCRGAVPGAAKAPEALREAGLHARLGESGARDAGVVLPGRYVDDEGSRPARQVRNQGELVRHAGLVAGRLTRLLDDGAAPLVLGGDCSVLVGIGLALARRGGTGLVHIDGHTDFRHPGNSARIGAVAGEDLAVAVGVHTAALADIDGLAPYFDPARTVHLGHRQDDEHAAEVCETIGLTVPAADAATADVAELAARILKTAGPGFWLQVDVDVLDPAVMPAVDSPDPGGLEAARLTELLRELAPAAAGASVTVFDPDLDPDGVYAHLLADLIVDGLAELGTAAHS